MDIQIQNFFDAVLPSHGLLCIVGLMHDKSAPAVVKYFEMGSEEAHAEIKQLDATGREVYFGCASYVDSGRPKEVRNVHSIKSFYIDIDCGKDDGYKDKKEALVALAEFCQTTMLPVPTLVDSGFGVHGYWSLTHSIDYNTWKPVANALKKKAAEKLLKIDPVVTGDGARLLRVPRTLNKKRTNDHRRVLLRGIQPAIDLETFKACIGYMDFGIAQKPNEDPVMAALLNHSKSYKFSRIHRKNLEMVDVVESVEEAYTLSDGSNALRLVKKKVSKTAGCAQLAYCVANSHALSENLWKAALSIAWYCTDQQEAIKAVSKGYIDAEGHETHPDDWHYHASRWNAPRTCEWFKSCEKASLCNGCIHSGKINTPIVLGAVIDEATPEDNVVEVLHEGLGEKLMIEIPDDYPRPYFRPKTGGVAIRINVSKDPEDTEAVEEKLICSRDLWIKQRSKDAHGELATLAYMLPHDGLNEFTASMSSLYKTDSLRDLLASRGVPEAGDDNKLKLIKKYLSAWSEKLQNTSAADKARTQFGWQEGDEAFVLGHKEIDKHGNVKIATISHSVEGIAKHYSKCGALEEWQRVANLYGRPNMEARAFSLFASFGAPLYKFIGEGSILMHLTNVASGVGKSTALKLCNSVWGHPTDTMMIEQDTTNAKLHRAGVINNMPVTFDELTNMKPEAVSDLSFCLSQGRGKNRMQAMTNSERINDTTWSTIFQSSGNNSLYDILQMHKSVVEGEILRIMQLSIPLDLSLSKEDADLHFTKILPKNYGHAGEAFMRYVVPNKHNVIERMLEFQKEFDAIAGLGSKERFYSSAFAASFTAAEIANKLGIIDIPIAPVKKWAEELLVDMRRAVRKGGLSTESFTPLVSRFWNEHQQNILAINKGSNPVDTALMNQAALKPVIGALIGRYEVVDNRLYISAADFDAWLTQGRNPTVQILNGLRKEGCLVFEGKMNLGKDTVIYRTGALDVYGFDTLKLDGASVCQ